ncbi:MAG: hypothetical protein WAU86_15140 [Oricola sp.]
MFTASRRIRSERKTHRSKATALIIATLVFANVIAIAGLGATARADEFPDALQYAPMTWDKQLPVLPVTPVAPKAAATTTTIVPVARKAVEPVAVPAAAERRFVEVRTPSIARSGIAHHRYLLIALMTLALGAMAAVSVHMFRGLARDIDETERRRSRR